MKDAADWLAFYRQFWEQRLDRLENYVAELQAKEEEDGSYPQTRAATATPRPYLN